MTVFPFSLVVAVRITQIFNVGISQGLKDAVRLLTVRVARTTSCDQKRLIFVTVLVTMSRDHALPKIGVISLGMTGEGTPALHA